MIAEIKVKVMKKFLPHVPGQKNALIDVGRVGAGLIRERVERKGRHADGKLPFASRDKWFTAAKDPRFRDIDTLDPRHPKGSTGEKRGEASLLVATNGYQEFKASQSGQRRRSQSLTGKAWNSLAITLTDRGVGHKRVYVRFAGSVKTGVVADARRKSGKRIIRVYNRDKMKLSQYSHREKGTGKNKSQVGPPDYELMKFTQGEMDSLAALYLSRVKFWR